MRIFRVATRPSLLAYTQTNHVVEMLRAKHPNFKFEIIKFSTHGDRFIDKALTTFGGVGLFVKELEEALLKNQADFAVHSLKDVPSIQPEGLELVAFPRREDVRDVVLTKSNIPFVELCKEPCVVGTGSPRRILQLMSLNSMASFLDIRGNVDTRMEKLMSGSYDAIVLAAAGLKRLGKNISEASYLSVEDCIPAFGQGSLALECRSEDGETKSLLRSVNHLETEQAVIGERSYMITIGGGCKFPLAAYANVDKGNIYMKAMIGDHNKGLQFRFADSSSVSDAELLGAGLAKQALSAATKHGLDLSYLNR